MRLIGVLLLALTAAPCLASPESEEADLVSRFIRPGQLKRLVIETPLVREGKPVAFIGIADDDAYRRRARAINAALKEMSGAELPVKVAATVPQAEAEGTGSILLGNLDNNPLIARLYHLYYDCLDTGYTGKGGYELRSVHDPFARGTNCIVAGGSDGAGADAAAQALVQIIRASVRGKDIVLPRLMQLKLRAEGRMGTLPGRLSPEEAGRVLAQDLAGYDKEGLGRSWASAIVRHAMLYHRYGDPAELGIYRKLVQRHIRYYAEDPYIRSSLRRYDREFRDSFAWQFVVTWDLLEEEPLFTDEERLAITNHCLRLVQECFLYQHWDSADTVASWAKNRDIVHNHLTWPGLACWFGARYFGGYYNHPYAKDWRTVADGIFNGQKLACKPQEDAASYQWLPLRHTITWSLAGGDATFFKEGHARQAAETALMLTDNLGNQPAFGDHTDWTSTGGIPDLLGRCAWYYRDGRYLWGAQRAGGGLAGELMETYAPPVEPRPAVDLVGIRISRLPRQCYDHTVRQAQYPVAPNQPYEASFDKLTFRSGLDPGDQYLLLDGYARGNHMHLDGNAIVHYADRGACWLVDGEYIRNTPKYHSSLTVLREGESALLPAVAGLVCQADLGHTGFTSTRVVGYNGAAWTRHLLWQKGDYFVAFDEVAAEKAGDYTLGSAWRVLGEPKLEGSTVTCKQRALSLQVCSAEGLPGVLSFQRMAGEWPIHSLLFRSSRRLGKGETCLFRTLFYASSPDRPQALKVTPAGDRGVVITGGSEPAWWGIASSAKPARRAGVETDAALFRVTPSGYALVGARQLAAGQVLFRSAGSDPSAAVEANAATGEVLFAGDAATAVELRLAPGAAWEMGDLKGTAGADGLVKLTVPAGRHTLKTKPFALPAALAEAAKATPGTGPAVAAAGAPAARPAWTFEGFTAERRPIVVQGVTSSAPHTGRWGPVEKLVDGRYSSSTNSVQWAAGVAPEVTLDLGSVQEVQSLRLRAWEFAESQRGTRREVSLSDDGFRADVRRIPGDFSPAGTESFGANVNSLYTLAVGQRGRAIRIRFTPANQQGSVYLAEVEVFGNTPGRRAEITALASGDLVPGGATVSATATGQIVAVDAAGRKLWEHQAPGRVRALAVADLDGDGRPEVIAGGEPAWLLCLDAAGKVRWENRPAPYRGIAGDVTTLAVGDLEGDGKPEVVAGLLCWKYLALDGGGKLKWGSIIYAHGATACALADVDGRGSRSVIAGNAYYRLNLLGPDGKVRWQNYTFGPEHTCAAAADLNGDGRDEILAGSDLGEFHAIDGEGKRLWGINAGDAVRAILVDRHARTAPEVYAAGESGFVYACKPDGSLRWKRPVGDAVASALLADADGDGQPEIVAAAGSAGVAVLGRDGKVRRTLRAASPVVAVQVLPGKQPRIVAALADGSLAAW